MKIYSIILEQLQNLFDSFNTTQVFVNVAEIVFLAGIIYFLYRKYIKGTNSENLIRGVLVLVVLWFLSELFILFGLGVVGVFLRTFVAIITFGLIVVFQPELRRFLGYLGQGNLFARVFLSPKQDKGKERGAQIIKEIMDTLKYLSKNKIGALIILKNTNDGTLGYEVGTEINGEISQELLLTIFHPNTPLHDGAVIICNTKIQSAGVLLPLTEDPKLSWRYGTRHRAAIGASETFDCACIVVSEETGNISIAIDGELTKCEDLGELKIKIERILRISDDEQKQQKNLLLKFEKKDNKEE